MLACGWVEREATEVDEAGSLKAPENGVGSLFALRRGPVEELGEVDEL